MTINVRDYGAIGNGKAEDGAIQAAVNAASEGEIIFFPATSTNKYLIYKTITVDKGLSFLADHGVQIVNGASANEVNAGVSGSAAFLCTPTSSESLFVFQGIEFVSGGMGIHISSSLAIHPLSRAEDCKFSSIASKSVFIQAPGGNFSIDRCLIAGLGGTTGVLFETNANFDLISVQNTIIRNQVKEAVRVKKALMVAPGGSGSIYCHNLTLVSNAQGIIFDNATGSAVNIRYVLNTANVVMSGSGLLSTGSAFVS